MKRFPTYYFEADAGGGGGGSASTGGDRGATLLAGDGGAVAQDAGTSASSGQAVPGAWLKDDSGAFADGWIDRLPGDLNGNASLRSVPTLEALAKNYVETKAMVGKRLEAPGAEATPDQLAAWRKVVGAPEKPEGYLGDAKSLRPESIPENLWDGESEKRFLEIAHKHHLPPAAVKDILAYYGESISSSLVKSQESERTVLQGEGAKLRQVWGKDFDTNLSLASRMAKTVGLDPESHPIFTSAEVVQAFAKMGHLLSEDRLVSGGSTSIAGTLKDRISDITDPKSSSTLAREYRGEFGPERQKAAQDQLHGLMSATTKA